MDQTAARELARSVQIRPGENPNISFSLDPIQAGISSHPVGLEREIEDEFVSNAEREGSQAHFLVSTFECTVPVSELRQHDHDYQSWLDEAMEYLGRLHRNDVMES